MELELFLPGSPGGSKKKKKKKNCQIRERPVRFTDRVVYAPLCKLRDTSAEHVLDYSCGD